MCFEPLTKTKAGGEPRLLIVDGHGSYVTASFVRFCIDHNIIVLLLPPHSSHITQPLDVGIFSPLKQIMSQELDKILRYGFNDIQTFEWANCYRLARPYDMKPSNIKNAWSGAGLLPFNPQKVIRRLKAPIADNDVAELVASTNPPPLSPQSSKFDLVPNTASKLDSGVFRSANEALISKIEAGILDTPVKAYILKLVGLSEHLRAHNIVVQHNYDSVTEIASKRRVMAHGKRVVLKDQTLITTEEMYQKIKACEDERAKRRTKIGGGERKRVSGASLESVDDGEGSEETNEVVMLDVIEVAME